MPVWAHTDWMRRRGKKLRRSPAIVRGSGLSNRRRERLKFLSGFKADGLAGRDADLLAGAGVAANAGLAALHIEDTEAAEFDAIAASESILHGFEYGLYGLFGLRPGDTGLRDYGVYDVGIDHNSLQRSGSLW